LSPLFKIGGSKLKGESPKVIISDPVGNPFKLSFAKFKGATQSSIPLCGIEDWGCCNLLGLVFYALHRRLVYGRAIKAYSHKEYEGTQHLFLNLAELILNAA
jgi:hypothetical protein